MAQFVLTGRDVAIIGAALSRCLGWDDPRELRRFVNVAAEYVRDGWTEQEMADVLDTLCGQWAKRGVAGVLKSDT